MSIHSYYSYHLKICNSRSSRFSYLIMPHVKIRTTISYFRCSLSTYIPLIVSTIGCDATHLVRSGSGSSSRSSTPFGRSTPKTASAALWNDSHSASTSADGRPEALSGGSRKMRACQGEHVPQLIVMRARASLTCTPTPARRHHRHHRHHRHRLRRSRAMTPIRRPRRRSAGWRCCCPWLRNMRACQGVSTMSDIRSVTPKNIAKCLSTNITMVIKLLKRI